ncbi:MAG: dihydrofolate reductase [Actinobacteria bacterium]|uniref:Unannotated protein n=1 Tax=freshwater metagenome TaxID=449393 RepID=A0A6J7P7V4_9ZZZZ|nr:dihydrofolate reductase [Actinomycetota bacterium]
MSPIALIPQRIAPVSTQANVVVYDEVIADELLESARFFVPTYLGPVENLMLMSRMPNLEVCQLLTAGYEGALPHLPPGVTLCNAAGVHDASTAELAVGLILASLRGIDRSARDMAAGAWDHRTLASLADRRVLIIGAGGVGDAIRRRLEPFETTIVMMGRSARDGIAAISELDAHLPWADIVVLAVPLDPTTASLVDAAFLARMPDGALLVNVARGGVVDTAALLAETTSGRILAALDVTDPEPLPADHPLWRSPGVLITPHVGGDSTAFVPRGRRLVERQLENWATGQPLINVIPLP